MKFKDYPTDDGINLLEKRILPALDKIGKTCDLYLTPDHLFFLHHLLTPTPSTPSPNSTANPSSTTTASPATTPTTSPSPSTSPSSTAASAPSSPSTPTPETSTPTASSSSSSRSSPPHSTDPTPFLTFEAKGHRSAVVHDVPISKPLSRAHVHDLQTAVDNAQEMPATLVRAPELNPLQNFVDRMKHIGDVIGVSITKYGICICKFQQA